jgi:hypothetical protein
MTTPTEAPDRCTVCGMPMRSLEDDGVVLDTQLAGGWGFAHGWCHAKADLDPYFIEFARIVDRGDPFNPNLRDGESLVGWLDHLRAKSWFTESMEEGLHAAHAEALRLAGGA